MVKLGRFEIFGKDIGKEIGCLGGNECLIRLVFKIFLLFIVFKFCWLEIELWYNVCVIWLGLCIWIFWLCFNEECEFKMLGVLILCCVGKVILVGDFLGVEDG